MPNGPYHKKVGTWVGGAAAAALAWDEKPYHLLLETIGGVIGGTLLSRLPDIIDPPTSPMHRSVGHGVLTNGAGAVRYIRYLKHMQRRLRDLAEEHADSDPVWAALCRMAAGAVAGALAGVASHLVLDAQTPAGLPWVC